MPVLSLLSDSMAQLPSQLQGLDQEPVMVQIDPKCIKLALKEFLEPVRTNDSRADFYAVYRRESGEFDKDYAGKYDGDLNTSLLFAGLSSAVSSAFIIGVQPKLEPDPNEMTAAYMKILIHAVNNSLFPDANPDSVAWTGPPPEIVTVQAILYASLATSFLAAFLAMLGKQWVNRYTRNHGGSAAEKSRNRQQKLDGLEEWRFHLIIESLPVMLQIAMLLLGCATAKYLWTISRTVACVIVVFAAFWVTSYMSFTIAAVCYHACPYQTPLSIPIRALVKIISERGFRRLNSRVRRALRNLGCAPGALVDPPRAVAPEPRNWNFGEIPVDMVVYKGDAHCISWVLRSATDGDVIFRTAQFAAEMILYPEIADVLEPRILANHFLGCLEDGRVIPDRLEHTNAIGLALASVLSVQLCVDPERRELEDISHTIRTYTDWIFLSEPIFLPGVAILRIVSRSPERVRRETFPVWEDISDIPGHLSTTQKLSLSRTVLQTVWRWRRVQGAAGTLNLKAVDLFCKVLMANDDHTPPALRINCFLIMAVSLGNPIDSIKTLFTPNTDDALRVAIALFHAQLRGSIEGANIEQQALTSVLSTLVYLDPFQALRSGDLGFSWITELLRSEYPEKARYLMASQVLELLDNHFESGDPNCPLDPRPTWIPPLVCFLSLYKKFYNADSQKFSRSMAVRVLSASQRPSDFNITVLPLLTLALSPTHPLQMRRFTLKIFHEFASEWCSPSMENVSDVDLGNLLHAVGDPFEFIPDPPPHDQRSASTVDYDPMKATVVLIEFASSDLWRNHLRLSNFTSCERVVATEDGQSHAHRCMVWPEFLCTPSKVVAAVKRLEELECQNIARVVNAWATSPHIQCPVPVVDGS